MRILVLLITLLAVDLRSEWDSLVEAERAFSRLSVERGIKDSFLANLSDDGIIFRPNAVSGKEWMQNNPASPAQLTWEPDFADVAAAGDFGYTTGPWEIRRSAQDPPAGFGHYVTLWRKQNDGRWKVELDVGIGHDAGPKPSGVASPRLSGPVQTASPAADLQRARDALIAAERSFPTTSDRYTGMLAPDARVYRDGKMPIVGEQSFRTVLNSEKESFSWKFQSSGISKSADLGYTYGTAETSSAGAKAETKNYLRIWKRQPNGQWRVVLDLVA